MTQFLGGGQALSGSIFDKLDTDSNGVLSEQEVQAFKEQISKAAGDDGKLSKQEAQGFMESLGIKGKVEGFYGFLNSMMSQSGKIKSSNSDTQNNTQTTDYNDGSSATVDIEGNIVTTQADGSAVKTDRNGNKLSEVHLIKAESGETEGTFTTEYGTDGTKSCDITDTAEKTETVTYNSEGNAATRDVLEKETSTHDFYDYDANGENPVLKTRIENEGKPEETATSFKYSEDGKISQTTTTPKGGEDVVTDYEYQTIDNPERGKAEVCTQTSGKGTENEIVRTEIKDELNMRRTVNTKTSETTTEENYKTCYDDQGNEYEVWAGETTRTKDGKTIKAFPDGDGVKTTVTVPGDDGCTVVTKTNGEGKNEYQSFTQNGKTTTVQYTPEGNTRTVMQVHENFDSISNTFGVSKEELLAANPDKKPNDFGPGASIVIPGEIPASEMVGRKDYEGVASDVKNYNNGLQKQHRQNNIKRLEDEVHLDPKTYTENGRKVILNEAVGTKTQTQEWSSGEKTTQNVTEWGNAQQYRVVGKTKGGEHYIVRDKNNGLHYANKDLTHIEHLSTEDMGNAVDFKNGKGKKIMVKHFDKEDAYDGQKEIMLTGKKDQYGNEYGVTDRGLEVIIDKKTGRGCYVGSKYDKKLQYTNKLENNTPELGAKVTEELTARIEDAQENLDDYLRHETWSEKAADRLTGYADDAWNAVSGKSLSDNTEKKVKNDLAEAKKQLQDLDKYKNNPELYAKKFEQTFGVPYDARKVTNYITANSEQKEEARIDAFGNGKISNILGRVDNYIDSQVKGGEAVEFGVTAGVTIATGGTGGTITQTVFSANRAYQGRLSTPQGNSRYGRTFSEGWDAQDWTHNIGKVALDAGVSYALKGNKAQKFIRGSWEIDSTAVKQSAKQCLKTGGKEGKAALAKNTATYVLNKAPNAINESLAEEYTKELGMAAIDGTSGLVTGNYDNLKYTAENSIISSVSDQLEFDANSIGSKIKNKAVKTAREKYVKPAVNNFARKTKGVISKGIKHIT